MKKLVIALPLLLAAPALAQQSSPSTPAEQAMSQRILAEVSASLQCSAGLISTSAELTKANARIKDVEEKLASQATSLSQQPGAKPQ